MPPRRSGEEDETWEHCIPVNPGNKQHLKCNYCRQQYHGGVFRMKHHLARTKKNVAACTKNPDVVQVKFQNILKGILDSKKERNEAMCEAGGGADFYFHDKESPIVVEVDGNDDEKRRQAKGKGPMDAFVARKEGEGGKQQTLNTVWKKGEREKVCMDIARFFYANALPFNLVRSPFFAPMCQSIARFGQGLKLPSYHEIRNNFLKEEVKNIEGMLAKYKKEWEKKGCTIMSDGWTDGRNRSITNFLVNSPSGTVFLRSVDTSAIVKNAENLCDLLDSIVQEVGEDNVVQVITDNASSYVKAGKLLMEKRNHLFWTPCAAHCIDLMLEDLGKRKIEAYAIKNAKIVANFIYSHGMVLNMMRSFTKGKELIRPAVTRFATSFLTLKSLLQLKTEIRSMFASQKWADLPISQKPKGEHVHDIIFEKKFWQSIIYSCKVASPLVKVLRLVDGDHTPAMGYIYEAMDRAKEEIAENLGQAKNKYGPIWKLIDERWNCQLHQPLHAAAYYLNPRFQYDESFKADMEIKTGLYDCLDRMAKSTEERIHIDEQLDLFRNAKGLFGRNTAILTRKTKQPAIWWEDYGDSAPELQKVAIRILSLTCSASGCERNWSTFEQIHTKRRNRLEAMRLNALVFVKYNLQLRVRETLRKEKQNLDPICLSDIDSDDEWITEQEEPTLPIDQSWLTITDDMFEDDVEVQVINDEGRKRRRPNKLPIRSTGQKEAGKGREEVEAHDVDDIVEEVEDVEDDDDIDDIDDIDDNVMFDGPIDI